MKKLYLLLTILVLSACGAGSHKFNVVPYPNEVEFHNGEFCPIGATIKCGPDMDSASVKIAEDFGATISGSDGKGTIEFLHDSDIEDEAYVIEVKRNGAVVKASGFKGFNYAIQTMRQMLPVFPCCTINDSPRFAYRGLHLDVARHFFDTDVVKRYIDIMVLHKMNTFHWHLTDDQGWRIEIKAYPRLTEVGSVRKQTIVGHYHKSKEYDGVPYGGYYTQEQIRDVVEYAASKGVTVIPEIDLPGHMIAALTAYPELGCTGGPYELWCTWGISDDVLCPGKESTFEFIENVLDEVMDMFPSEYIHVGGDECPKVRWEVCPHCQARIKELGLAADAKHSAEHYLQSYVMTRVEKYLNAHGRRIIGWDEILEGGLAPDATVMSWRGEAGGIEAASQGHNVIMSPNTYYYLDYCQGRDLEFEPLAIGGYLPLEKCYSYEPYAPSMTEEQTKHILGVQANLWTEYVKTEEHLQYMILPRVAALSEVQWCNADRKDYSRFVDSMDEMCKLYESLGYNYAKHVFNVRCSIQTTEDGKVMVSLESQGGTPIYYTLDGTQPTKSSSLYVGPIEITEDCVLTADVFRDDVATRPLRREFDVHKAFGCSVVMNTQPHRRYRTNAPYGLTDGVRGIENHNCEDWIGWNGDPVDVTIDLRTQTECSSVTLGTILNKPSYLFNPLAITVSVSSDGESFKEVSSVSYPYEGPNDPDGLKEYKLEFAPVQARYIKICAQTARELPSWHVKHGRRVGYLFLDEILVK